MVFWLIAALVALVVMAVLARAMLRRGADTRTPAAAYDIQVYRDQLKELERDLARGTVNQADAERARVEISRRILEADRALAAASAGTPAPAGLTYGVLGVSALLIVGGGFWLYGIEGAPGYPDMPLKTRISSAAETRDNRPSQAQAEAELPVWPGPPADAPADYLDLITQLRAAVLGRPDDLAGQSLLANHESAIGNYIGAHQAMARVVALKGESASADEFARYADLMIMAGNGYVSPEAEAALTQALRRDETNPVARYYSGLMFAQTGRPDIAFRLWRTLLEDGPANAPWNVPIRAQIEQLAAMAGENYTLPRAPAAGPGPSQADIAAAGDMSDEDRNAMINSMVDRLSDRLATEGGPASDWARLIGALGVLGDTQRAAAIWGEAQTVFEGKAEDLAAIHAAAVSAGVAE